MKHLTSATSVFSLNYTRMYMLRCVLFLCGGVNCVVVVHILD